MTRVMDQLQDELKKATAWLTTNDLMNLLNRSRSSVGRGLRRLWAADKVDKEIVGTRPKMRAWLAIENRNKGLASATIVAAAPTSKKSRKKPTQTSLALIVSNTFQSQGDFDMQIEAAIETVASEWVTAQKKFSAHDITKELRDRAEAGTIQVDPGPEGTVHVGNKDVAKISHKAVREAVHNLMTSGKFDYDRKWAGDHYEYEPKVDDPDPTNPGTPQTPPTSGTYDGSSTL